MGQTGHKDSAEMNMKGFFQHLFCQHDWEKDGNPIQLETALPKLPSLQAIKLDSTDIFYDRLILIFKCTKCNKTKIWKSYNNRRTGKTVERNKTTNIHKS